MYRGTIYFPPGVYRVNSSITFNAGGELSIIFRGEGLLSQLTGNFAGYILDRPTQDGTPGIRIVEQLDIKNTHLAGGGIRILGTDGAEVRNCRVQAHVGVAIGGNVPAPGALTSDTCFDTSVNSCQIIGLGSAEAGSIGVMQGMHTAVYNCSIANFEHGIRAFGPAINIIGCRIRANRMGFCLGVDASGTPWPIMGGRITGISMEDNQTAIYGGSMCATQVSGIAISGSKYSLWSSRYRHPLLGRK